MRVGIIFRFRSTITPRIHDASTSLDSTLSLSLWWFRAGDRQQLSYRLVEDIPPTWHWNNVRIFYCCILFEDLFFESDDRQADETVASGAQPQPLFPRMRCLRSLSVGLVLGFQTVNWQGLKLAVTLDFILPCNCQILISSNSGIFRVWGGWKSWFRGQSCRHQAHDHPSLFRNSGCHICEFQNWISFRSHCCVPLHVVLKCRNGTE